jgi:hypothetical protein
MLQSYTPIGVHYRKQYGLNHYIVKQEKANTLSRSQREAQQHNARGFVTSKPVILR